MCELSRADVCKVLKCELKTNNYEIVTYEQSYAREEPSALLSTTGKAVIKYKKDNIVRELQLFIRAVPTTSTPQVSIYLTKRLEKEAKFYQTFLSDISSAFKCTFIPKYYFYKIPSSIIFEDFNSTGFQSLDVSEVLDLKHCEKTLETLAKFHSYSIILEKTRGRTIEELYPDFLTKESNFSDSCEDISVLRKVIDTYLPQYSKNVVDTAYELMRSTISKLRRWDGFKNVIIHRDLWMSNLMFQYDNHGVLVEAGLVGLESAAISCPTLDVQMLLHNCTRRKVREGNEPHLLRVYYRTLVHSVTTHCPGLKPDDVMPLGDFLAMYEATLPVALSLAPLLLHLDLLPAEVLSSVTGRRTDITLLTQQERLTIVLAAMQHFPNYRDRLLEAIVELFTYIIS